MMHTFVHFYIIAGTVENGTADRKKLGAIVFSNEVGVFCFFFIVKDLCDESAIFTILPPRNVECALVFHFTSNHSSERAH